MYTPERDDEHPRLFHMGVPPPGDKGANTADVSVRYYFPDAWHAESLVRDKEIHILTKQRIFDDRSDPQSELPHKQIPKSGPKKLTKPRTVAISESANPLKFCSKSEIRAK